MAEVDAIWAQNSGVLLAAEAVKVPDFMLFTLPDAASEAIATGAAHVPSTQYESVSPDVRVALSHSVRLKYIEEKPTVDAQKRQETEAEATADALDQLLLLYALMGLDDINTPVAVANPGAPPRLDAHVVLDCEQLSNDQPATMTPIGAVVLEVLHDMPPSV